MGLELSFEAIEALHHEQRAAMRAPPDVHGPAPSMPHDQACPDPAAERDPWTQYAIDCDQNASSKTRMNTGESRSSLTPQPQASRSSPACANRCLREASRAAHDVRRTVPSRSLRPDESASLQTLGKQTKTIAIPPQELDDVASAPAKHEDVSGERLLLKNGLHLRTQTIEATAHIGHAGGDPDLRSCAEARSLAQTLKNRPHQRPDRRRSPR